MFGNVGGAVSYSLVWLICWCWGGKVDVNETIV